VGAPDSSDETQVSRRGFLGWGAALLTVTVVPVAGLVLGENPAGAATLSSSKLSPYSLAGWQELVEHTVVATAANGSSRTLTVLAVTDLAKATTRTMTGDVFSVGFKVATPLPAGIYTITASHLGRFPLFISGRTTTQALINTRVPARN
jgi:hypothetical protein